MLRFFTKAMARVRAPALYISTLRAWASSSAVMATNNLIHEGK